MNRKKTKRFLKYVLVLIIPVYFNASSYAATLPLDELEKITNSEAEPAHERVFDSLSQDDKNDFDGLSSPFSSLREDYKRGELDKAINTLEALKKDNNDDLKVNQMLVLSYLKAKRFAEARSIITDLLKKYPKKPSLYKQLALLEILQSDNKTAAINNFKKAIELDANDIDAYVGLAKISSDENKLSETEDYLKKILTIDDKYIPAYLDLAILAAKQGKNADVEKYLNIAYQKVSGNFDREMEITGIKQQWYAKQKQFNKALEQAEDLVKKYPNEKQPLSFLANAQFDSGKIDMAESSLRKIIAIDKEDIESRLKLANLLGKQPEKQNEALKLLDEIESIKPDYQAIYLIKAAFFIKQKQFEQAQKTADKARQQLPQSTIAEQIEGDIYFNQGEFDRSLEAYLKVYKSQPDNRLLFFITKLLSQQGRQQEAIDLLSNELKKTPDNLSLHYELATIYLNQGLYDQAKKHYLAVVDKKPDNVLVLNNLAYLYAAEQSPEAMVYAQKAHKLAPDTPVVLDTYGYLLVKQGNLKEGLPLLERAAKLLPDNAEVQFHLAKAYFLKGDRALAAQVLNKIAKSSQSFPEKAEMKKLLEQVK
jgi:putative PEP-CTERM system TPR-repeat lipoprotein